MNKDIPNMALDLSGSDSTMETVMKNIYTSCDPNNLNSVPTSDLIEFIKPYLLEDLSALETLKNMLDPENINKSVAGEKFYDVMNEWTQKIASHSGEEGDEQFNETCCQVNDEDEKILPCSQSTPKPSFGQKLLSCEGLLNLSNVSIYNVSPTKQTKDISIGAPEKTLLEEEVKQLQYQLSRVLKDMEMLKVQLTFAEEQNEILAEDLERCQLRLQSEQQVSDHLQETKSCVDDLKEDINLGKKRIEELNKKLTFYENDNAYLNTYVQKLEKENSELEERCLHLTKAEQNRKKEFFNLRTELDMKEHEIASISRINEELRLKLCEKMTELEQLLNENELLDYKQQGLEKMLSSKRYSISSHYNTCLDEMSSILSRGSTIPIYSSPIKNKSYSNSPSLIKKVLSPNPKLLYQMLNSSTPKHSNGLGMRKAFSLNMMSTRSLPNIFCFERSNIVQDQGGDGEPETQPSILGAGPYESLQTELFQVDPEFDHKDKNGTDSEQEEQLLKIENESLQKKLDKVEEEKKLLLEECTNVQHKATELEKKLNNLMLEKEKSEELKTDNLDTTLSKMRDDFTRVQSELETKEKELFELKNQFNFEPVYKKLEFEYSKKINELENIKQSYKDSQNEVSNLRNSNIDLETTLKQQEVELQETKDKLKLTEKLHVNIEQTANKVQAHVDDKSTIISELHATNVIFKSKIEKLEAELKDKINQLNQVKDILQSDIDIKNRLWKDNEELRSDLAVLAGDYKAMMEKVADNENIKKDMEAEHDKLLSKFDEQIVKNNELFSQISTQNQDISDLQEKFVDINIKHQKELSKNVTLLEQVSLLKSEAENIKQDQQICKEEILRKLTDYETSLQNLYSKIKSLESENESLKTNLNFEKQKSNVKVSEVQFETDYEDSGVRSDIGLDEDRNKNYLDGDTSSESSLVTFSYDKNLLAPKHRSFEKLKLTIDRLRDELSREKSKSEVLKERIMTNKNKQEKTHNLEIESLQNTAQELNKKLNEQEEYYKHICKASNEKIKELSVELTYLNDKHNSTLLDLNEKESLLKRTFEVQEYNKAVIEKLDREYNECINIQNCLSTDLASKEIVLKNITIENQNLILIAQNSESKIQELRTKLKNQESALKKYKTELVSKNEEVSTLASTLLDKENKIQTLSSETASYQAKLSDILLNLSKKDETCSSLERELQAIKENLSRTVNDKEHDLEEQTIIKDSSDCYSKPVTDETTLEKMSSFTDIIADCCVELNRAFNRFIEQWRSKIDSHPNFKQLPSIKLCQSLDVEDVISVIVENIKTIILLINIMSTPHSNGMEDKPDSDLTYLKNQQNTETPDSKSLKKFTLRPEKLRFSRPISTEHPSTEIPHYRSNKHHLEKENNSPDSQNFITSEGESVCCYNFSTHLPLLTFELPIQDAFPHVSDNILEKLGLHENSPKVKLTKEETEEIFTTFAIQVGLDSKDIKERLQKQKDSCAQKYKKYQYVLKDITMRLREHSCIGAKDSIKPVFVLLEDVRFLMQDLMQSAGQLGVLTSEYRMTKCWNLVTNYMAIIKQDLGFHKEQPSADKSFCDQNKKNSIEEEIKTPVSKTSAKELLTDNAKDNSSSCLSRFAHFVIWVSFFSLLFFIGVIFVHLQCKMTTEYKICPLDDFIRIISQRVGNPPY